MFYMPCEEKCVGSNLDVFEEVLNKISCITYKYNATFSVNGGDFNTDFRRKSPQTNSLLRFIHSERLFSPSCRGSATPDDIINYQNCLNTNLQNVYVHPVLTQ